MSGLSLIILAATIGFVVTIITSNIFDRKEVKPKQIFRANRKSVIPYKRITVLVCFAVSLVISAVQYINEKAKEAKKEIADKLNNQLRDSTIRAEKNISDSIADMRGQQRTDSTVAAITRALAEYNLAYDEKTNRVMRVLNDSLRTLKTEPEPVLSICDGDAKGISMPYHDAFSYIFRLNVCGDNAPLTNVDAYSYGILTTSFPDSAKYIYASRQEIASKNIKISPTLSFQRPWQFFFNRPTNYTYLFAILRGTYTNLSGTKTYNIDIVYYYNIQGNTWGMVSGETEKKVRAFLASRIKSQ